MAPLDTGKLDIRYWKANIRVLWSEGHEGLERKELPIVRCCVSLLPFQSDNSTSHRHAECPHLWKEELLSSAF